MSDRITLRQLRYFMVLAEELNFRRAAERLFITQPPLSRQIRQLEEALGASLLLRQRSGPEQGVHLTTEGHWLLPRIRQLLLQVDTMLQGFGDLHRHAGMSVDTGRLSNEAAVLRGRIQKDGLLPSSPGHSGRAVLNSIGSAKRKSAAKNTPFRLGMTPAIDTAQFSGSEAVLHEKHPRLQMETVLQGTPQLIRSVLRGRLDAAIISLPARTEGLVVTELHEEALWVCLASQHPLARRRRLSLQDIGHEPLFWFARRQNPVYYDHCQKIFAQQRFSPPRLPEPQDQAVLLAQVADGLGVALVPASLRSTRRRGVVFRPLVEGDALCIRVALARRSGGYSKAVSRTMASLLNALRPA